MESDQSVLLLNSTYEPLTVVPARRAMNLLFSKKAHTVEESNYFMSTVRARIRVPSVIQIVYFVKKPYSKPKFSKRSVFIRDNYQCQYCGRHTAKPTIDHVIPRSKNGKNDWTNAVTACHECNNKKGDQTLKAAGMKLMHQPKEPQYMVYSTIITPTRMKKWERYFNPQEKITDAMLAMSAT